MKKFDAQETFVLDSLAKQDVKNKFKQENMDLTYDTNGENVIYAVFNYKDVELRMWNQEDDSGVLEVELSRLLENGIALSHRLTFCDQNIEYCKKHIIDSIVALRLISNVKI